MSKDKIIQGPWGQPNIRVPDKGPSSPSPHPENDKIILDSDGSVPESIGKEDVLSPPVPAGTPLRLGPVDLNAEQLKAMQLIASGATFVFIAIRPTDNGADFLTALHGDPTDLRNAQSHLPDVIERLYGRNGI